LADAAPEFLLGNPKLVLKAIRKVKREHETQFSRIIPGAIYQHRNILKAGLRKGWDVLQTRQPNSEFRSDRRLIRLAVKYNWKSFAFSSSSLRKDRDFVLPLMKIDGRTLKFAADGLQYDYELWKAALSDEESVIAHTYDGSDHDLNFLMSFAETIQEKLNHHESFLFDFLRGMRSPTEAITPAVEGSGEHQSHPKTVTSQLWSAGARLR